MKETEEGLVTWHLSASLGKYGLFLKSNSELIGNINFRPETNEKVFIAYTLNKNFWKLEYATEALQKLISLSFKQLGIKQILAKVHSENRASITFLLKLGFSLWLILKVISNTIEAMLLMS
ncbi:GNAT family N-acetyltransferase [Streptococcus intermedius]|uniref:GNAT family N-acetyltransferase n=1 Tax=Streptococcus intermedius TaxID=1338 RepID=UPI000E3E4C1C|nr:GNAT family N-acetyltransferase [Streptococcus intermedius]